MDINGTFQVQQQDDTVVLTPLINLGELEYERIESDGKAVLDRLASAHWKNVVIDSDKTDYYGSAALAFFVRLWKRSRMQDGHMAFCNLSPHVLEILQFTRLDTVWSICGSRDEALDAVQNQNGQ